MNRSIRLLARALSVPLAVVALTGCDSAGDGDADGDVDSDGADAEADSDRDEADGEADVEHDGDPDRDLARCGAGTEPCHVCHGTDESAAPPPDTAGRTDPAEVTVGAHQAHLQGSDLADAFDCSECHRVPSQVLDPGHCDSEEPAEVRFGDLASSDGVYPFWRRESASCEMVYCHGATLDGASEPSPSWTEGSAMACGSCHRRNYHDQTDCRCHTNVTDEREIIDPTLHVNGEVEF